MTNKHGAKVPAGHVIDHVDAWRLVRQGVAVPADDECEKAANMTPAQHAAARRAYERVSRGIAPEDYDAFDRGEMIGYDERGHWIPGPTYNGGDDE
jgi:hypothetical protein